MNARRTRHAGILRLGLSLVEVLVVIAIIAIVAAIAYPVYHSARGESQVTHCIERLRQMGLGIAIYRENNNGGATGYAWEMGLPTTYEGLLEVQGGVAMKCHAINYALKKTGDLTFFGGAERGGAWTEEWPEWVLANGESTVMLGDPNHNPDKNFGNPNYPHLGLALALDTSVRRIRKAGDNLDSAWWQTHPRKMRP